MSMISLLSPNGTFNPAIAADAYKGSHNEIIEMYPDINKLMFYQEARGGAYQKIVQFSMQMMLKMFFAKPMTKELVDEAEEFWMRMTGAFNRRGWHEIVNKYHGRYPLEIWGLPEGTVVPVSTPLTAHWNTGGNSTAWLAGFFETLIQRYSWVGTTVATNTFYSRKIIEKFLLLTDEEEMVAAILDFMLNDFGSRGTKDPIFTGGGFLLSSKGTDNNEAAYAMNHAYNCNQSGFSIRYASEHSQMTLRGEDGEFDVAMKIIEKYGPQKCIFAMVIDAYSQSKFLNMMATPKFKEKIMKLGDLGSTIVFRPDSGVPEENFPLVIKTLMNGFGFETNRKGFDMLPPFIKSLQGDAVNRQSLPVILQSLVDEKLAVSNARLGSGGGALEQNDRDTIKYAMKLCAEEVTVGEDTSWIGRNKCPEGAEWKASKAGQVGAYWKEGEIDAVSMSTEKLNALSAADRAKYTLAFVPFFRNGDILQNESLDDDIRPRLLGYKGEIEV